MEIVNLIELALGAAERSYAPYSSYKVGCAVEMSDGVVFQGCNIENASYGITMCAERVAIYNAISYNDCKEIKTIVVANVESYPYPCGACRQVIMEFGKNAHVVVARSREDYIKYNIKDLLPAAFDIEDKSEYVEEITQDKDGDE